MAPKNEVAQLEKDLIAAVEKRIGKVTVTEKLGYGRLSHDDKTIGYLRRQNGGLAFQVEPRIRSTEDIEKAADLTALAFSINAKPKAGKVVEAPKRQAKPDPKPSQKAKAEKAASIAVIPPTLVV